VGAFGGLGVLAALGTGNYEAAALFGLAVAIVVFLIWFAHQKKTLNDTMAMTPQYAPSSRVAAAQKIADFVPPVPGSELVIEHRPKKQAKVANAK
jgi:hypothetical protein